MKDSRSAFGFGGGSPDENDLKDLASSADFAPRPRSSGDTRNARASADQVAADLGFDSRERGKPRRRRAVEQRESFTMMLRVSDMTKFRTFADDLEMSFPDAFSELLKRALKDQGS